MKKAFTWWQITGMILEIISIVFMVLCFATDINDDLFLPAAICCTGGANILLMAFNIRRMKANKQK